MTHPTLGISTAGAPDADPLRELAQRIARDLFTNGAGERASRLVLELPDGRDGGGWCEAAVVDRVERALREEGVHP